MGALDYFERKLDDKRRLTIPVELRHEFEGGEVIITRGFGEYLHLYTKTVWDEKLEPRLKGDILSQEVADLNVRFRMGKMSQAMDGKQGRITIDQSLLDYAGIDRDIVAIRSGDYWRIVAKEL